MPWRHHTEIGADNTVHVWPDPDSMEHLFDTPCPCKPGLEEQGNGRVLVSHRDALGRYLASSIKGVIFMTITVAFDKPSYNPGDTIKLTVTSDQRIQSDTLPVRTGGEGASATLIVRDGVDIDDPRSGRVWTLVSDDGNVAVFSTTAVFYST